MDGNEQKDDPPDEGKSQEYENRHEGPQGPAPPEKTDQTQEVKDEPEPVAQASLPTLPVQIHLGKTDGVYNFRKGKEFQPKIYNINEFQKDKYQEDKHEYDVFGDAFREKNDSTNKPQKDEIDTNQEGIPCSSVSKPASPTTPYSNRDTCRNASENKQTETSMSKLQARIPEGSIFHTAAGGVTVSETINNSSKISTGSDESRTTSTAHDITNLEGKPHSPQKKATSDSEFKTPRLWRRSSRVVIAEDKKTLRRTNQEPSKALTKGKKERTNVK
ncbi:hypothetical protein JTB14_021185 [Gonioctena quinquepunctata]|nr:hypothetical protein JTB14_021185 [Gonioctena quinquepunctata]